MNRDAPSAAALHKRAERARKRAAGLKRIELWIDPRIERTVRAAIKRAFADGPVHTVGLSDRRSELHEPLRQWAQKVLESISR